MADRSVAARAGTRRWWKEPLFSDLRACPACRHVPRVRLDGLDARWMVECTHCGRCLREELRVGLESLVRLWNAAPPVSAARRA